MHALIVKPKKMALFVSFFQLILLFGYLGLNIQNVGEMGIALPLLAGFVGVSGLLVFNQVIRLTLVLRLHLFIFLLLISWIALRVIIDLGDMNHLKQLTVATTGGMLLFFMIGNFARQALDKLNQTASSRLHLKLVIVLFALVSLAIFISFKDRLLDRPDIFYIEGVEGGYQRPGNFLIMLFIMTSFAYLALAAHPFTKGFLRFTIWLGIYTLGLVLALISSQMIGSNSATANLLAIYMMTSVISLLALSKRIRRRFNQGSLSLPLSKFTLKKLFVYSGVNLLVALFLAIIAIQVTGFDLSKTRAFGFGAGSNNSVTSRFDILLETGSAQLGHAPFLGNVNVAELTTGNAGRTLHNFIPNVMAELGLVGLILVLAILLYSFAVLIKNIKQAPTNPSGLGMAVINFWLVFVFTWLFLYANFSVGKGWPVMWFFVGFAVQVFIFDKSRRNPIRKPDKLIAYG